MFGAPFVFDQFHGEPVEQLGMGWRRAKFSEVVKAGDDAPAEVVFPNAVHPHARGEGMVRLREPTREGEAIAGFVFAGGLRGLKGFAGEHLRQSRLHERPGLPRLPRRFTYVGEDSPRSHSARMSG